MVRKKLATLSNFVLHFYFSHETILKLYKAYNNFYLDSLRSVVLVVIAPSLPRDGGTARTAIQVHAINLFKIRLGEKWQPISNQS